MSYYYISYLSLGNQEVARQVYAEMRSPMVQTILDTGIDWGRVKNVIERRLRNTGTVVAYTKNI